MRKSSTDGCIQRAVPDSLRDRLLYLAHYPRLAGHPGGSRRYQSLKKDFYWPNLANDIFQTPRHCRSFIAVRGALRRDSSRLKLFPSSGPLEFVPVDILGPLPKAADGYQYILLITHPLSKMTRAILMSTIAAATVAGQFLTSCSYPYGTPTFFLAVHGPQFVAKFFEAVCRMFAVRYWRTTAYHPQTNRRTERFNRTLVTSTSSSALDDVVKKDRVSKAPRATTSRAFSSSKDITADPATADIFPAIYEAEITPQTE